MGALTKLARRSLTSTFPAAAVPMCVRRVRLLCNWRQCVFARVISIYAQQYGRVLRWKKERADH